MIEAEWFGGPYDGEVWALVGSHAFPIETVFDAAADWIEGAASSFHVKWVAPELVDGRWLLVWRE